MMENIDRRMGELIEEVRRRGELDNTLIVFSSDHGEMFGERNRWGKNKPWQSSAGVPPIVAGPGIGKGVTRDRPVSAMDLAATFLDYGGVAIPPEVDSRSLRPCLEGTRELPRDVVRCGLDRWRLVCDGRHKLISGYDIVRERSNPDAPPALYDLRADPLEQTDIATQHPDVVARLTALLDR